MKLPAVSSPSTYADVPPPLADVAPPLEGQGSFKLEGWWLRLRQFHGLIVKRFHCAKRNTKGLFSQIMLPAFFVCVAMTVALSVPEIGEGGRPLRAAVYCHLFSFLSFIRCSLC